MHHATLFFSSHKVQHPSGIVVDHISLLCYKFSIPRGEQRRFHDFPVDNYMEPDHPAQAMIRKIMGEMCNIEDVKYGIDGCGVPTFYMPLSRIVMGFARLANPDGLAPKRKEAATRIVEAMQTHPEMTGEIKKWRL